MKNIPEQIQQIRSLANQYKFSQLLMAAEALGVFQVVGISPTPIKAVASQLGLDELRLGPILNALASIGVLKKIDECYCLDEDFSVLSPSHASSQLDYIRFTREVMLRWLNLTDAVRKNDISVTNFKDITGKNAVATDYFVGAMDVNAKPQASYLVKNFDFSNSFNLDIGAGAGTYSIEVGRSFQNSRGLLLELPGVSPLTKNKISKVGLNERFAVISGDYKKALPAGEFDNVFLFAIIHQEQPHSVVDLLNRIRSVLKPNGRLFVSSFFLDESMAAPIFAVLFAVEMVIMTPSGRVYSNGEIEDLFREGRFKKINRVDNVPGPATLYVLQV